MNIADKPSVALRQAVADLEKCEEDKRFEINMGNWALTVDGVCQVCLAGAILVQQCGIPDEGVSLSTNDLPDNIAAKMWGIDAFRVGRIWDGIAMFNDPDGGYCVASGGMKADEVRGLPQYVDVEPYYGYCDGKVFKDRMRQITDMLEKVGY